MTVFSHAGQCVRDLERARAFYVDVFGFEEVLDLDVSGAPTAKLLQLPEPVTMRAVYLRRDGFVLELLAFTEPEPLPTEVRPITAPGLTHISLGVEDLDATAAAVVEHGGELLPDTRLPNAMFVRDCEGQLVELLVGTAFAHRLHGD